MGSFVLKEGRGSLFVNNRKESDNHPDWNGSIMIQGVEYWLSGWTKQGNNGGADYFSLSLGKPKEARQAPQRAQPQRAGARPSAPPEPDFDDQIPF